MTAVLDDFNPISYKISSIQNWNVAARGYHEDWVSTDKGPFGSTAELVKAADVGLDSVVLDVACGTGAVSMHIERLLGSFGMLVGVDFSRGALSIAKSSAPTGEFIEMDVENLGLRSKFDRIVCQYALMFFPEPTQVLRNLRSLLKVGGIFALAVHGTTKEVPYFSTIMDPILKHIPDIRPKGTPTVHRFGKMDDLSKVLAIAGFSGISIKKFEFKYETDSFDEYWSDYLSTTANSIRATIESKGPDMVNAIREEARAKSQEFMHGNKVVFPWQVLVATGMRAQD